MPQKKVALTAKSWKSQFDEWEKYWREYQVKIYFIFSNLIIYLQAYKTQYEAWAREQKKLGIDVPPPEPPKDPPNPTAEVVENSLHSALKFACSSGLHASDRRALREEARGANAARNRENHWYAHHPKEAHGLLIYLLINKPQVGN